MNRIKYKKCQLVEAYLLVWFWQARESRPERAHLQCTDACGLHHEWMYIKSIPFSFTTIRTYALWTSQISFSDTSSSQTDASTIYIIYMHCFHLYRKRFAVFWCACFILPVWIFKCYVLSRACLHYLGNVQKAVLMWLLILSKQTKKRTLENVNSVLHWHYHLVQKWKRIAYLCIHFV